MMPDLESAPNLRCPTCRTKGKITLDAATQQVTCTECGQASLVLITPEPEPEPVKPRRTRSARSRRT
ncbi:hypothetical protein [Planobispora takensis]|uniref:Uncharacterized protein n=1 Tax=Planobispora takensis TaxID=1367882 RepID=A0A8J3TF24_9ACTN|nr:hypothetical protein [Planobispora takensis]GII06169.1 hypothetical protein Pta02_81770 [Planobispora takensis]